MNNFEHNRESWNELTTLHADSSFYDIDSFKQLNYEWVENRVS